MSKAKTASSRSDKSKRSRDKDGDKAKDAATSARNTRETVESVVVAIILAFLFRAFVAEAFVIPTGSMAPTLQGRHKDVVCSQCGHRYRTGASVEMSDGNVQVKSVIGTTCPICRYTMAMTPQLDSNQSSFTGDRILVSKFAYQLFEPQRWDVIVFKFPGNAKQNYIKRLIGLPNEELRIFHGDIYVRPLGGDTFTIARKPPHKVRAMLQLVDDTQHLPTDLRAAGWPSRWQQWDVPTEDARSWKVAESGQSFAHDGQGTGDQWLRYQHIVPDYQDWLEIVEGTPNLDFSAREGQLISDFYAYNGFTTDGTTEPSYPPQAGSLGEPPLSGTAGLHWVGDLALEANVEVQGSSGELLLDLVEGGVHYTCRIDVATGTATAQINNGQGQFDSVDGQAAEAAPTAATSIQGPGTYHLRLANVDNQLLLWVNNWYVPFDRPTSYTPTTAVNPKWNPNELGDLAPVGIGTRGLAVNVERARVLRDVYYVATKRPDGAFTSDSSDYEGYEHALASVPGILGDKTSWDITDLFDSRRAVDFTLEADQFFPLGDNSPQSKDARLWETKPMVERRMLTGKALMIYWPHHWWAPVPFLPNFGRMGFIR